MSLSRDREDGGGKGADAGRVEALLRLVRRQCDFGPRYPGAPGHRLLTAFLHDALAGGLKDGRVFAQDFSIYFEGAQRTCTNLIAVKYSPARRRGPLLIGTHFDSRARADNETDEARRRLPIPGANDGGSGTAILIDLLPSLSQMRFNRDIHIVLFDAEDVGGIEGLDFAVGARFLAAHPLPMPPEEVIVLDLVGGPRQVFDIDLHVFEHEGSMRLAHEIFTLAERLTFTPLIAPKPHKFKYIIADHHPFHERGIPAFIFIDIDYPEWHTLADGPAAVSGESLVAVEDFIRALLEEYRID